MACKLASGVLLLGALADDSQYSKGELGTNACPDGFSKVRDTEECKAASTALGFTWGGEFQKTGMPDGCLYYWDGSTATTYNNGVTSGQAADNSAPICAGGSPSPSPSPSPTPPAPSPSPKPPPAGQVTGSMTFEGKERTWVMYVPSGTPTGLVVSVHPVLDADVGGICSWIGMEEVMKQTGALVVCPAALSRAGVKGGGEGACWKAWGHYGSCESPDEDSEDVDFLAAMIQQISQEYSIAPGKTIMSGMSNGGSMAFRFNCEQSDLIDGLVIQSQAYLDPWIGFYDYEHDRFPTGTPQCSPTKKVPFYSDIGTADVYYGSDVAEQYRGFPDWQTYSTVVLGCTGQPSTTSEGPVMPQGATTCYEYASCPRITSSGINRYCNVTGMEHDPSHMDVILNKAFSDFFDGHMVV